MCVCARYEEGTVTSFLSIYIFYDFVIVLWLKL